MQVDIVLKNAKVYDIGKADILLGESFNLLTNGDGTEDLFSDHDEVLQVNQTGINAVCSALAVGVSKLRWMNAAPGTSSGVIKEVIITVFTPANDLGLSADAPVAK
jgi:hypothetical protein